LNPWKDQAENHHQWQKQFQPFIHERTLSGHLLGARVR
jgi:hypothetical protein